MEENVRLRGKETNERMERIKNTVRRSDVKIVPIGTEARGVEALESN